MDGATALPALLVLVTVIGCPSKREAEVKDWPGTTPLSKGPAGSASKPAKGLEPLPPRAELTDIAAALSAPPDGGNTVDGAGPSDTNGPPSDVVEVKSWVGMTTCDRLIETACAYLGIHSQECAEVRGWRTPVPSEEVLGECQAIVDQFEMTYNQRGVRRVRNPCWSHAYDVCRDFGRTSEECIDSRAAARRLRTPSLRKACKGGILIYEAKRAFPDWGPNSAPRAVRTKRQKR